MEPNVEILSPNRKPSFAEALVLRQVALDEERCGGFGHAHTIKTVARIVGVPLSTVYAAISSGRLPTLLVRRRRIVQHDAMMTWATRRRSWSPTFSDYVFVDQCRSKLRRGT